MPNLTQIRAFIVGDHAYRHAINLDDDSVLLQRLNEDAETPEEEWESLLGFDAFCNVWEVATSNAIGRFRTKHWDTLRWVFTDSATGAHTICEDANKPESLLDSEVTISKQWLANNPA